MSAIALELQSPPGARQASRRELTAFVGMWIFLASGAVLFGSLLSAYALLRSRQPSWPPAGAAAPPTGLAALSTLVLVVSSMAYAAGQRRADRGDRALGPLLITLALGVAFLLIQTSVCGALWSAAAGAGPGLFGGVLGLLIGCHAVHVAAALLALAWVSFGVATGKIAGVRPAPIHVCGLFWHFLDVTWIALFITLFLI